MRQEVEGKLVGYHPDALRNDPDLRRDKAEEANDIMAKMGAFMGAASWYLSGSKLATKSLY